MIKLKAIVKKPFWGYETNPFVSVGPCLKGEGYEVLLSKMLLKKFNLNVDDEVVVTIK